jgi:hypothetical protein
MALIDLPLAADVEYNPAFAKRIMALFDALSAFQPQKQSALELLGLEIKQIQIDFPDLLELEKNALRLCAYILQLKSFNIVCGQQLVLRAGLSIADLPAKLTIIHNHYAQIKEIDAGWLITVADSLLHCAELNIQQSSLLVLVQCMLAEIYRSNGLVISTITEKLLALCNTELSLDKVKVALTTQNKHKRESKELKIKRLQQQYQQLLYFCDIYSQLLRLFVMAEEIKSIRTYLQTGLESWVNRHKDNELYQNYLFLLNSVRLQVKNSKKDLNTYLDRQLIVESRLYDIMYCISTAEAELKKFKAAIPTPLLISNQDVFLEQTYSPYITEKDLLLILTDMLTTKKRMLDLVVKVMRSLSTNNIDGFYTIMLELGRLIHSLKSLDFQDIKSSLTIEKIDSLEKFESYQAGHKVDLFKKLDDLLELYKAAKEFLFKHINHYKFEGSASYHDKTTNHTVSHEVYPKVVLLKAIALSYADLEQVEQNLNQRNQQLDAALEALKVKIELKIAKESIRLKKMQSAQAKTPQLSGSQAQPITGNAVEEDAEAHEITEFNDLVTIGVPGLERAATPAELKAAGWVKVTYSKLSHDKHLTRKAPNIEVKNTQSYIKKIIWESTFPKKSLASFFSPAASSNIPFSVFNFRVYGSYAEALCASLGKSKGVAQTKEFITKELPEHPEALPINTIEQSEKSKTATDLRLTLKRSINFFDTSFPEYCPLISLQGLLHEPIRQIAYRFINSPKRISASMQNNMLYLLQTANHNVSDNKQKLIISYAQLYALYAEQSINATRMALGFDRIEHALIFSEQANMFLKHANIAINDFMPTCRKAQNIIETLKNNLIICQEYLNNFDNKISKFEFKAMNIFWFYPSFADNARLAEPVKLQYIPLPDNWDATNVFDFKSEAGASCYKEALKFGHYLNIITAEIKAIETNAATSSSRHDELLEVRKNLLTQYNYCLRAARADMLESSESSGLLRHILDHQIAKSHDDLETLENTLCNNQVSSYKI